MGFEATCDATGRAGPGRGFTMVELLIGIAVVAILVTLAAPSFLRLLVKQQVSSATNDLVADLQMARTAAVSRGQLVGVVANSGDWLDGWAVQPDSAPQTAGYTAAAGTPLRAHEALDADFTASADRSGAITTLVFAQDGSVYDTATNARATADTVFSLCKPAGSQAQAMTLVVHASGLMESYRDASVTGASCP